MEDKKGMIVFTKYSPYTVVGVELDSSDGKKIETAGVYSLCRCGKSKNKPFCDGSHVAAGFVGNKETYDTVGTKDYVGKEITIHDNRHMCSFLFACHHGEPEVFDNTKTPWINPDGTDDIEKLIEVIKQCPSGALSYTRDGQLITDWFEDQKIVIEKNGPYHVQGKIDLIDDLDSKQYYMTKDHYALCRCGHSKNKPFCDGSHHAAKFNDEE